MSTFTNNILQVNFIADYLLMDDSLVNMLKTLEASGLKGFFGCDIYIYEEWLFNSLQLTRFLIRKWFAQWLTKVYPFLKHPLHSHLVFQKMGSQSSTDCLHHNWRNEGQVFLLRSSSGIFLKEEGDKVGIQFVERHSSKVPHCKGWIFRPLYCWNTGNDDRHLCWHQNKLVYHHLQCSNSLGIWSNI